jgi:hypothetical protein
MDSDLLDHVSEQIELLKPGDWQLKEQACGKGVKLEMFTPCHQACSQGQQVYQERSRQVAFSPIQPDLPEDKIVTQNDVNPLLATCLKNMPD